VVLKCNGHIEKSYLTHLIALNMIVLKVESQKIFLKIQFFPLVNDAHKVLLRNTKKKKLKLLVVKIFTFVNWLEKLNFLFEA